MLGRAVDSCTGSINYIGRKRRSYAPKLAQVAEVRKSHEACQRWQETSMDESHGSYRQDWPATLHDFVGPFGQCCIGLPQRRQAPFDSS
jgi:hypothetical protein